jgi:hypothetical protein
MGQIENKFKELVSHVIFHERIHAYAQWHNKTYL